MIASLRHVLGWMVSAFSSREDLILENLALRQQLLALHAKRPRRRLTALDKLFWVALKTFWSGWTKPLVLVTPRTVVGWHRAGFRLYWTWVSRAPTRLLHLVSTGNRAGSKFPPEFRLIAKGVAFN
jgi:hypothetical protein